jgi:hypothetical protein
VAAHIFGWIAGVCLATFAVVGVWMIQPVMWNPFRAPTTAERDVFSAHRARIPFAVWFGLGLLGLAALAVFAALK